MTKGDFRNKNSYYTDTKIIFFSFSEMLAKHMILRYVNKVLI